MLLESGGRVHTGSWFAAMALIAVCDMPRLHAQQPGALDIVGRPAVQADSVSLTVGEAEAQGRKWLSASAGDTLPDQHVAVRGGGPERACVDVGAIQGGSEGNIRSADFAVAGFDAYPGLWHAGYGKLAWVPVNGSAESPRHMMLAATRLDGPPSQRVYEVTLNRGKYYMYPADVRLPRTGRWLLVGRAGHSWGCFVFTLR
jgi:hypothetical protein